jgi:hypothetical protein
MALQLKKLAWFAAIWAISVSVLALVGLAIRSVLQ